MSETKSISKVAIRPGVSILGLLRHLNYRPWYALAEFVDNSLQSYINNQSILHETEGRNYRLNVSIELDLSENGRIVIRDNAAGIKSEDYPRAFRPAEAPKDTKGLSEFGIGMKSAACWFSSKWSVRTSALGEPLEREVVFDIEKIVEDKIEELQIITRPAQKNAHFTEIILSDLHHPIQGRTVSKIREHLTSIYRVFFREDMLCLKIGDEYLLYEEPEILTAPNFRALKSSPAVWKKNINFDFGKGLKVKGFAALRAKASTSMAGFALFRRNRLIQGSADETYRPEIIFGKANSYRYQRLFGELHLEGFDISHTKDGFRWDENEEVFLEILKEHLEKPPLDLLEQAEGHRVRAPQKELIRGAEIATENIAEAVEENVPPVLVNQFKEGLEKSGTPTSLPKTTLQAANREINVELNGHPWQIVIETTIDPSIGDWLSISDKPEFKDPKTNRKVRRLFVRMSLTHPFMDNFCGSDVNTMEALLRVAAATGLAHTSAKDVGATFTNTILRNLNDLLRNALSQP